MRGHVFAQQCLNIPSQLVCWSSQSSGLTTDRRNGTEKQDAVFEVFLPHAGGVTADLGGVFPLAAFYSAAFPLKQMAYPLLCYPVTIWFCEGKLQ